MTELHERIVAAAAEAGGSARVVADELVARGGGVELRAVTLAIDVDAPGLGLAVLVDNTLAAEAVGQGLLRVRYRVVAAV